ncbi:MAG: purine-nucleoside phosphorylase [Odoribacteraceae bacterium]|jgi:purine-nucleoside phosphorylase|nr:purine-nucleoside phosphorylase [Odoribacteraceae bacterium]
MLDKINESTAFLAPLLGGEPPRVAIILGSGLGAFADDIAGRREIPYAAIPRFPVSTVAGHAGRLVAGEIEGKSVLVMQGRFHFYEGYSMQEVTFPVRVAHALGARTLLVTNAAGGVNPLFRAGDLMVIEDHVNMFPDHPLRGENHDALGPRFPSMEFAYSPRLISLAVAAAERLGIRLHRGVYAGLQGPSFETPAECRWLHAAGADAVGMSTVPEVIVARHAGMECFGVSVIANSAPPLPSPLPSSLSSSPHPVSHEVVLEQSRQASLHLSSLLRHLLRHL